MAVDPVAEARSIIQTALKGLEDEARSLERALAGRAGLGSTETVVYPRLDGVRFLESFGTKEDSDAIELARSGTKVAETFGMSDATIYSWLKQGRIDRRGAEMSLKELQVLPVPNFSNRYPWKLSTESSTQKRKSSKEMIGV